MNWFASIYLPSIYTTIRIEKSQLSSKKGIAVWKGYNMLWITMNILWVYTLGSGK